ncbi:sulfotransferase family protein [Vreelandella aquamarina]|uniref:hypothetical protein n=1 Tax=Vreelandella aquamarina TaxID=77097 RepID=UPI00384EDC74
MTYKSKNAALKSRASLLISCSKGRGLLSFTYIRKNASTSFKKLFQELYPDTCPGDLPTIRCMAEHSQVKGLTLEEIDQRFATKLFVYRDPIDPVFSVYKNKLIQQDGTVDLLKRLDKGRGRSVKKRTTMPTTSSTLHPHY